MNGDQRARVWNLGNGPRERVCFNGGTFALFLIDADIIVTSNIFILAGSADSGQSRNIYGYVEGSYVLVGRFVIKIAFTIFCVLSLVSILFPISYALFEYPPPELWTLPIEIQ